MTEVKKPRGFAAMTPERQREIAAMGGRAVKPENRSFSRDSDKASEAGRKGGLACPKEKRAFFRDRELARKMGALGGAATKEKYEEGK